MAKEPVGIFGGSGLYELLEGAEEVRLDTPFGPPSDAIFLGEIGGRPVAFMPRHGRGHTIPPHKINFRANLQAMSQVGVSRVVGPAAVGSLRAELAPGSIVIPDQFVDRTWGRADTFWDGPQVEHLAAAHPYCPELGDLAEARGRAAGIAMHRGQTMVVIQGPRFNTNAESTSYSRQGWGVVGMTGYPEVVLARELGMCYASLALVTDYDAGLEGSPEVKPVSHQEVLRVFAANIDRVKALLSEVVAGLPELRSCDCLSSSTPFPRSAL
ncbi:MAG: S-methyl-5'-thioadenosine phosphorylase [Candidatus Dormiibacterota bacterium]